MLAAQKALVEAVVAATKAQTTLSRMLGIFLLLPQLVLSAILPEERSDIMYHRYDGGGMVIDGPSVLIRKNLGDSVSVSGGYYVDKVSSASIDVMTIKGASRYSEERTEYSGDLTYLVEKTTITAGYTQSDENDYSAKNYRLDLSQTFFSEMTSISAGFSLGDDEISRSDDATEAVRFNDTLERRNYRFGLSQILSKNLLVNVNYESIIDEGYTQNPYRKILLTWCNGGGIADLESCPIASRQAKLANEKYPRTRNSDAYSIKFSYHLPWDAALKSRLGYFSDSWGIDGASAEIDYSHRFDDKLIADVRVRYYQQGDADFYANEFFALVDDPEENDIPVTFYGRDKELAEHSSFSIGLGASYRYDLDGYFTSLELNTQIDYFIFNYDNFREYTSTPTGDVLSAPLYDFSAYALRVFATIRY